MKNSIGILECSSIGRGIEITDIMVKASSVDVKIARPICSGKFFMLITGEVSEVEEAILTAQYAEGEPKLKSVLIPNVHPDIRLGLSHKYRVLSLGAIGILELKSIVPAIKALDKSLKSAEVSLAKLNLSSGIGMKSYYIIGGDLASVKEAMEEGSRCAEENQILSNVVISAPSVEILRSLDLIKIRENESLFFQDKKGES